MGMCRYRVGKVKDEFDPAGFEPSARHRDWPAEGRGAFGGARFQRFQPGEVFRGFMRD